MSPGLKCPHRYLFFRFPCPFFGGALPRRFSLSNFTFFLLR